MFSESYTLLTTETNLFVIALPPLDERWQFVLTYLIHSSESVSFQTDENRLSIQTLGTETSWSICRLTDRGSAEIDSSELCQEQIRLKDVKIT